MNFQLNLAKLSWGQKVTKVRKAQDNQQILVTVITYVIYWQYKKLSFVYSGFCEISSVALVTGETSL